jgi:hypothetical protein
MSKSLVVSTTSGQMVAASGADALLAEIRAEWRAKDLIARVERLLPVDPSSACQRLLNAAIHDLRDKIIIAGLDVAEAAADLNRLPTIKKAEDVLDLSTTYTLDLAYRMGIISRPDWRRLKRAYDIRKDLEHEDDQYEAGIEDCVYVFRTCIEIVLSKDPIAPLKVVDVKDIIESPSHVTLSTDTISDYESAPDLRQVEIYKLLVSTAGDDKKPDIVRQNAIEALRSLRPNTRKAALAEIGTHIQEKLKTRDVKTEDMKIAAAGGFSAYLKQSKVKDYLNGFLKEIKRIGYDWRKYEDHRKIFDDLEDIGGADVFPKSLRSELVEWIVLCYIGEPGGYGIGAQRPVFYSNSAAPKIEGIFKNLGNELADDLESAAKTKFVKAATTNPHIARRLEKLRDLTSE